MSAENYRVLDYLLTDHITASDVGDVLPGLLYTEVRAARTREWVYQNYDKLTKKLPPYVVPFMPELLGGAAAWDANETLRRAIEIREGVIQNPDILAFQQRSGDYPHPRLA